MDIFEKIERVVDSSTTLLHLSSAFNLIQLSKSKLSYENFIIAEYLLKKRCKTLDIEYSELLDFVNESKAVNHEKY